MSAERPIAVVGGGLGGLAAAVTLAGRGHPVTIFEANDWLGGKAAVLQEGGYRFDMGPTILTYPPVLARVFAEAGRTPAGELDLVRLDPQWRCFFADGSKLDLVEDPAAMRANVTALTGSAGVADGYERFVGLSEGLHDISGRYFFWKSVGSVGDAIGGARGYLSPKVWADLAGLRMGRSVAGTVRGQVADGRVAQMIDHFTQYVGSAPDASPAVLCAIAHMQLGEGVWYPVGGTRAVPAALERVARELGVTVRTGTEVGRLLTDGHRVSGVETTTGERIDVAAVVANSDAVLTHRDLLTGRPRARFLARRKYEAACSGVVLFLGLDRRCEGLLHHNFVFSSDPGEEFESIYRRGEPAPDPTCYVCAPAATEPGVAPPGGEALYVLVHTPYLRPGQDWTAMLPAYRRTILEKLQTVPGLADLPERIVVERALTPADIRDRYRVLDGAIYGLASHGTFFGAFKPANRSPDVAGLYLGGGSAHPGPGMPMVMMSGWIAADAADQDLRGGASRPAPRRGVPATT